VHRALHIVQRMWTPISACLVSVCSVVLFSGIVYGQSEISIGSLGTPAGGAISISRSSTTTLTVSVDSPGLASGVNLILQLPPGVTFSSIQSNAGMVPPGTFTVLGAALADNRASILVYSDTDNFLSTSGVVAHVTLAASSNAPLGAYPITVLDTRERDIKSYEVRSPRGIGSLDGEAFKNTLHSRLWGRPISRQTSLTVLRQRSTNCEVSPTLTWQAGPLSSPKSSKPA